MIKKSIVSVITSAYDGFQLIPHFVQHYTELGVDQILLVVRGGRDEAIKWIPTPDKASILKVFYQSAGGFSDSDKREVEMRVVMESGIDLDDYLIWADLDEFQEYPAPLDEIVNKMNQSKDWALRGWVIDRLAGDGGFPLVEKDWSIWEQFPLECDLTGMVIGAWTQKIMLCRKRVRLAGGVAHDTENAYYDRVPIGKASDYRVHHFKWVGGVVERMKGRLEKDSLGGVYRAECQRFLALVNASGKIDLKDRRLNIRKGNIPVSYKGNHPK